MTARRDRRPVWTAARRARAAALLVAALLPLGAARAQLVDADRLFVVPEVGPETPVEVEADTLTWDWAARLAHLSGEVRLTLEGVVLTADAVTLDGAAQTVAAAGAVRLVEGPRRLTAARLLLHLDRPAAEADAVHVRLMQGERVRLSLDAGHLARVGARVWEGEELRFTPCDCGEGCRPSWSLTAASGTVVPGEGALLWWPTFRILDVPVLPLPVFYLPLAERRTGLLVPRVGWSGRSGFHLAEPFFLTLGPSFDLTLTGGWYSGRSPESAGLAPGTRPGVEGFEEGLEVRWFPLRRTRGSLRLEHLYDETVEGGAPRGHRETLALAHRTRFDGGGFGAAGWGLAADAFLASDAAFVSDLALRLERREVGVLRSGGRAFGTPNPLLGIEAGVLWLQDVRVATLGGRPRPLFGPDAPVTFQRLPELHAETSLVPLGAGFTARAAVHGLAFSSPGHAFDDAGTDGLLRGDLGWCDESRPDCASTGEGNGRFDPGETGPVLHGRVEADLGRGLHLGSWLAGRASVGVRGDGWRHAAVGGAPLRTGSRLYAVADAEVHTALARRFGDLVHRVVPYARWRLVPGVAASGTASGLDAWDTAVPAAGLHQGVLGVASRLARGGRTVLDLDLAQGFDLAAPRVREARVSAALAASPLAGLRLDGTVGWDWAAGRLTLGTGRLALRLPWGGSASARWTYVAPEASAWIRGGLDALFAAGGVPPSPFQDLPGVGAVTLHDLVLSARSHVVSGLSVRGSLRLDLSGEGARDPQPGVGLAWRSPCECWSASILAVWPPGQSAPELLFGLQLTDLGGVSTR